MKGLAKKKYKMGLVAKAGGIYNYHSLTFHFNQNGILDQKAFKAVMSGKLVKYSDIL